MDYFNGSQRSILCPCSRDSADRNLSSLQVLPIMYVQPFLGCWHPSMLSVLFVLMLVFLIDANVTFCHRKNVASFFHLRGIVLYCAQPLCPSLGKLVFGRRQFARPCLCLPCAKQSVLLDDEQSTQRVLFSDKFHYLMICHISSMSH